MHKPPSAKDGCLVLSLVLFINLCLYGVLIGMGVWAVVSVLRIMGVL